MKIKNILLLSFFLVLFNACKNAEKEAEGGEEEHTEEAGGHEESTEVIKISEQQFNTIGIQFGTMSKKNLKDVIKVNGVLTLPPQKQAKISALVAGRVKEIYATQGDMVKKGQRLALIEHPDIIRVQEEFLKVQGTLSLAQNEYNRQKELLAEKIIAAKKFQQAEAEYKTQRALHSSLSQQLQLMGISPESVKNGNIVSGAPITSPINGIVNHIGVTTGSYVESSQEMFEVLDNSVIRLSLKVFPKDASRINDKQKVAFTVASFQNQEFTAEIFSIGKSFEGNSGFIEVLAEVKNNTNRQLSPGMFVNARIITGDAQTNALPNDAIVAEGDLKYIFIKTDDAHEEHGEEKEHQHKEGEETAAHNEEGHEHKEGVAEEKAHEHKEGEKDEAHEHKEGEKEGSDGHEEEPGISFKRIEIKTGVSDMGFTEIISIGEIPPNAQIVTKGAFYLAAQLKKNQGGGGEAEHDH